MKQAFAFALLAVLLISCGDGSDPVALASMPQPDLSVVSEPQLLGQVHMGTMVDWTSTCPTAGRKCGV